MSNTRKLVHEPGKIAGVLIPLGHQSFIVPPLNAKAIQQHEEDITRSQTDDTLSISEKIQIVCRVALSALQRNYPDMKLEFLVEWIDLRNGGEIMNAVLGVSGFDDSPGRSPRAHRLARSLRSHRHRHRLDMGLHRQRDDAAPHQRVAGALGRVSAGAYRHDVRVAGAHRQVVIQAQRARQIVDASRVGHERISGHAGRGLDVGRSASDAR
jgi:hypothetical protein